MHVKFLLLSFHNFNIETADNLVSYAFADICGKSILALSDTVHLRPDECVTGFSRGKAAHATPHSFQLQLNLLVQQGNFTLMHLRWLLYPTTQSTILHCLTLMFLSAMYKNFSSYTSFVLKKVINAHYAGCVNYPIARLCPSTSVRAGLALLFEGCSRQERAMESNSCVLKGLVI